MKYKDLRDFVGRLETLGELRRIRQPISPVLEMTELCDRVLRAGGPALLFEAPQGHALPVLGNLFGTPRRVALGMGIGGGPGAGDPDDQAAPLLCAGLIGYRAYTMIGDARRVGLYGFGNAAHILTQVARHQGRDSSSDRRVAPDQVERPSHSRTENEGIDHASVRDGISARAETRSAGGSRYRPGSPSQRCR